MGREGTRSPGPPPRYLYSHGRMLLVSSPTHLGLFTPSFGAPLERWLLQKDEALTLVFYTILSWQSGPK